MYVKRVEADLPRLGTPVSYDFEKGDWCKPYGIGVHGDFVFKVEKRFESIFDCDAQMSLFFTNPEDGLVSFTAMPRSGSAFRSSKLANLEGATNRLQRAIGYDKNKKKSYGLRLPEDMNYVFRVRTKIDSSGQVESALYGKIYGNIKVGGLDRKTAVVHFLYYLNPDGTRNLEFDPKQNLFKNDRRTYAP